MRLRQRYKRLNLWNKLAAWGAAASIVALVLTILFYLFPQTSSESAPVLAEAASSGPRGFDILDPAVFLVRSFDLRKEVGAETHVGDCPHVPCLRMELRALNLHEDPPQVDFSLSIPPYGRIFVPENGGVRLSMPLLKGCFFRISRGDYDVILEVQDDAVSSLRLWAAFLPPTGRAHSMSSERDCPRAAA